MGETRCQILQFMNFVAGRRSSPARMAETGKIRWPTNLPPSSKTAMRSEARVGSTTWRKNRSEGSAEFRSCHGRSKHTQPHKHIHARAQIHNFCELRKTKTSKSRNLISGRVSKGGEKKTTHSAHAQKFRASRHVSVALPQIQGSLK